MSRRILVADDEPDIRFILRAHLRRRGWQVDEAATGTEALDKLRTQQYAAAILDHRMPGASGLEVARESSVSIPTLVFSAYLDSQLRSELLDLGCLGLDKQDLDALLSFVDGLSGAAEPPTQSG